MLGKYHPPPWLITAAARVPVREAWLWWLLGLSFLLALLHSGALALELIALGQAKAASVLVVGGGLAAAMGAVILELASYQDAASADEHERERMP